MTGPEPEQLYKVIRYFQDGRQARVIRRNLTLQQAKQHCSEEKSKGEGWFDGFTKHRTYRKRRDKWDGVFPARRQG